MHLTLANRPLYKALTDLRSPIAYLALLKQPTARIATTPTGKVYTSMDILKLLDNNPIDSSSISAELKTNIIKDMINYANKNMKGNSASSVTRTLRWLAKQVGFNGLSWFNRFAQEVDKSFRVRVLIESLQAGETEAAAIQAARKALYDYNDLTAFEREYIASYVWFYRFMRQNFVQTMSAFIDNPAKVARLAKLSKLTPSRVSNDELHPDTQKYKDNRAFITLVEGLDKERVAIYTPPMPILDATAQLLDTMSMFSLLAT